MPLEGLTLTVEPRHPLPSLDGARMDGVPPPPADPDDVLVNTWFCVTRGCRVWVFRRPTGKSYGVPDVIGPHVTRYRMCLDQLAPVGYAWSADAEIEAQRKLKAEISEKAWQCYVLTGSFLETSRRSGVTYLFRRLRPTIAIGNGGDAPTPLAALCLHPIGYYVGTYIGAMVPTDDVLTHLTLMRGDEPYYWRKANQHPIWDTMAGL